MKQQITTDNTKSAHILSQAIVSGGFIFLSGQVHCNNELELVGDTTEEKLAQIMKNIETILKAADATLSDVVKVVIYVTDMNIMPDLNKAYPGYFTAPLPVREAVCAKELPLGASIEMSVIASADK